MQNNAEQKGIGYLLSLLYCHIEFPSQPSLSVKQFSGLRFAKRASVARWPFTRSAGTGPVPPAHAGSGARKTAWPSREVPLATHCRPSTGRPPETTGDSPGSAMKRRKESPGPNRTVSARKCVPLRRTIVAGAGGLPARAARVAFNAAETVFSGSACVPGLASLPAAQSTKKVAASPPCGGGGDGGGGGSACGAAANGGAIPAEALQPKCASSSASATWRRRSAPMAGCTTLA